MIRRDGSVSQYGIGNPWMRRIGQAVSAAAAFSPTDIAGLEIWHDYSNLTTLWQDSGRTTPVTADGDPIGAIDDLSGNSRHLTQGTSANKPTYKTAIRNGLSIGRYDGVNDDINSATFTAVAQPMTGFAVIAKIGTATTAAPVTDSSGTSGRRYHVVYQASSGGAKWAMFNGTQLISTSVPDTSYYYFSSLANGAASELWRNGTSIVSGNSGTGGIDQWLHGSNRLAGGANYWVGDIGEVLVYSGSLSVANRQLVETYLAEKWAI